MEQFLSSTFYHNTVSVWLTAVAVAVGCSLVLHAVRRLLEKRLTRFAARTTTQIDDMVVDLLGRTKAFFLFALAIELGSRWLVLPPLVTRIVDSVTVIAVLVQVAIWATRLLALLLTRSSRASGGDESLGGAFAIITVLGRVVLWSVILLLILDNLGVNITALVAGLGVGGIAVALALQNVLGDLFSSLSIILDKPFVVGDAINVDGIIGTVERIGLKTTRVRAMTGEQIVFSNTDLLKSRIRNIARLEQRRVIATFAVSHATPAQLLAEAPGIVRAAIEREGRAMFLRAHVKDITAAAIVLEYAYDVPSADYDVYLDVQQRIVLDVHRDFGSRGIAFVQAYPSFPFPHS